MDASLTHGFFTSDIALLLPTAHPNKFLQSPPRNSPQSHPFLFDEVLRQAYPFPTSHPAMDTSGGTLSPHAPFLPASLMLLPLALLAGSEISGNNMS
ncbi:hypothetical protein FRC07_007063 [Ceratobasidium sp. 392]|nr:hypothetical protein FRC07_007063 [Ceratobasidium sp. 392]